MDEREFMREGGFNEIHAQTQQPRIERAPICIDCHLPVASEIRISYIKVWNAVSVHVITAAPGLPGTKDDANKPE
jgi:hypothetical protein